MDKILEGVSGVFTPKGIGMALAFIAILVVLEKYNYAPSDLAAKI